MIEVSAAVLMKDGMVLIARRGPGQALSGMWEFPGGKIEPGETSEECLKRELLEEFAITARVGDFFAENIHAYGEKIVHLRAYHAEHVSGDLKLTVHDAAMLLDVADLSNFDFAPADIPFVKKLQERSAAQKAS